MGRFETLNADTQDLVTMLVPGLAKAWGLPEAVDIIPEEIRMRAWDCERREHVIDQTENDPRNWGVQFLKDLMAIRRIIGPDIDRFHEDLFKKVMDHGDDHPWCRLQDIKDLKKMYETPQVDEDEDAEEEEEVESDFEHQELVMTGKNGALKGEPQFVPQPVPKKNKRLRRDSDGNLFRPEIKMKKKSKKTVVVDDDEDESIVVSENNIAPQNYMPAPEMPYHMYAPNMHPSQGLRGTSSRARESSFDSAAPSRGHRFSTAATNSPPPRGPLSTGPTSPDGPGGEDAELSGEPIEVQALAAELAVAEAELKAARIKHLFLAARARAAENGE